MAIVPQLPVTRVRLYRATNNVAAAQAPVTATPTISFCTVVGFHGFIDLAPVTSTLDPDTNLVYLDLPATDDSNVNEQFAWHISFAESDRPARLVSVPQSGGFVSTITVEGGSMPAVWLDDLADFTGYSGPTAPDTLTQADLDALRAQIVGTAPTSYDTLGELLARVVGEEQARATLADVVAAKVAKATFTTKGDLLAATGSGAPDRLPVGSDGRVLTADSSVPAGVSWQTPTSGGGGGGSGQPDLPEASRLAYSAAISPPADLLTKTTRFTTASAISQTLPIALAGRVLAIGWDSGTAALTLAGASRTDTATVTGGSSNIADTTITAQDQGRLVTGTGIPAGSYVGTVTPNSSFVLSSSPSTSTAVNATASSTAVTISDVIGSGTATARTLETPGELLSLHATSQGQWRVYSASRPSERLTPVEKNADYTAQPGELVVMDTTAGVRTVTAPASGVGRAFAVKNKTGTNLVNVVRSGSDTLGSAAATSIPVRFDDQVTHFTYNPNTPSNWLIPQNHLPPTAVMAAETGTAFRAQLAATQSIPNNVGAGTIVSFPTVTRASALVTQATQGAGHQFTLNRAGVWMGSVTVRFPTATSGEAYVAVLAAPGGIVNALGSAFGGATATRCLPISGYFDAATVITVSVYQNSGAAQNIDHGSGAWCHIDLNWVRP